MTASEVRESQQRIEYREEISNLKHEIKDLAKARWDAIRARDAEIVSRDERIGDLERRVKNKDNLIDDQISEINELKREFDGDRECCGCERLHMADAQGDDQAKEIKAKRNYIDYLEKKVRDLEQRIENQAIHMSNYRAEINVQDIRIAGQAKYEEEIKKLKKEKRGLISYQHKQDTQIENLKNDLRKAIARHNVSNNVSKSRIEDLKRQLKEKNQQPMSCMECGTNIHKKLQEIEILQEQLHRLRFKKDEECSGCNELYSKSARAISLEIDLKSDRKRIRTMNAQIDDLRMALRGKNAQVEDLTEIVVDYQINPNKACDECQSLHLYKVQAIKHDKRVIELCKQREHNRVWAEKSEKELERVRMAHNEYRRQINAVKKVVQ